MIEHQHNGGRRPVWGGGKRVVAIALLTFGIIGGATCAQTWKERRQQRIERRKAFWERALGGDKKPKVEPPVAADRLGKPRHDVGYTVLSLPSRNHEGRSVTVHVAVWYPTTDKAKPFEYKLGQNRLETKLAYNGKPLAKPMPLLVYSHGASACGLSMAFLAERLAGEGFVVASPDYEDAHYAARIKGKQPTIDRQEQQAMMQWLLSLKEQQLNKAGKAYRAKLAYRPNQLKAVIDLLCRASKDSSSPLHNTIDPDRIALAGHSFGAWTSLLVAGLDPRFADDRVKAVVAFSGPCNDSVYEADEIGRIRVPIMFMFGGEEPKVGRASDKKYLYDRANSPKFLLEVAGADHFAFSGGIRREFDTVVEYLEKDARRNVMAKYSEAFLKFYLLNDAKAGDELQSKSPALLSYLMDFGSGSTRPSETP